MIAHVVCITLLPHLRDYLVTLPCFSMIKISSCNSQLFRQYLCELLQRPFFKKRFSARVQRRAPIVSARGSLSPGPASTSQITTLDPRPQLLTTTSFSMPLHILKRLEALTGPGVILIKVNSLRTCTVPPLFNILFYFKVYTHIRPKIMARHVPSSYRSTLQ